MSKVMDARQEFKAFYILLQQSSWFSKISSTHPLLKLFESTSRVEDVWEYSLKKFEFKGISLDRHIRPEMVSRLAKQELGESRLLLEINCRCLCNHVTNQIKDPIQTLGAKFIIQFEYLDELSEEMKLLQCSWHLDKHDLSKVTSTSHPLYHYEFGGTETSKMVNFNYGDFILLDSPRLMHPPLDLVLAFDFVIKNFYTFHDHRKLTESSEYRKYIKNAQYRIWKPYAISFASHFHDFKPVYEIDADFAGNILQCSNNIAKES
jgi:hypothetical protein